MSFEGMGEVRDYPLSDGDIRQLLGDVKIMTYPELKRMKSIDQCFDSKGRCIILFLTTSPTEGHWCAMLRKKKGIEFFDPYGEAPDAQKNDIPRSRLEQLDESQPDLTRLLRASGRPVYYNKHAFQKDKASVNTCGRHCVTRLACGNMSLAAYQKMIKGSGLSPDDFVSAYTWEKLHK
jgi:hypothetical protein